MDGYVYLYTDKSKIEGFRNGSLDSDLTQIEIDTKQTHGSQKNPYVIADANDWEKLVKLCTARANTTGKYFVLANDIDFSGVTFHPVLIFGGEFYGGGHTFSNITCSQWQYWTGSAYANITSQSRASFGVFCNVAGVIADLNIADYSFTGFPDVTYPSISNYGPNVGAVCGLSADVKTCFLNCHTQGQMSDGSTSYKVSHRVIRSGIVGESNIDTTAYRCSANITVQSSASKSPEGTPCVSGITGFTITGKAVYIYDCAATIDADISVANTFHHCGIASSWAFTKIVAEDVIGTIKVKSTKNASTGALLGGNTTDANAKNCFVAGTVDQNGALKNFNTIVSNTSINTANLVNLNYVKDQTSFVGTANANQFVYTGTAHSTNAALVANAKEYYKNDRIVDASKIDNFGNYNIENNPVRNMDVLYTRGKVVLNNPENIITTYNGDLQTVKSVVGADSTKYPWYNAKYYEHTDNYISLTYQDSKGATGVNAKDAGEYWVKAEITQAWIDAVNAAVEAEGTSLTDAQKEEAKQTRKPKFDGTPDTSDAAHVETDTVRWFKFTIKPAELDIPTAAEPSKTYTGSDIEFAISGYDSAKMTATPPAGYTLSDGGKISFKNANTYTINISIKDNNYCWKGTSSNPDRSAKTINITVTQKGIIINFTSSSGKFTMAVGENVTFTAVPSESDIVAGDTVIPTITYYKGSDTANITSATGAELNASGLSTGTYTLGAKLENKDGTANSNYKITTVTPKTVTVGSKTITIENVTWQYEQDDEYTAISGDSVVLTYNGKEFKFSVKETTEELRAKGVKIDSYTGNVQTNATNGTVTVKVKLVPYDESFEFSDETKTEEEFSLTVTINRAKIDFSKLVWSADPTKELEYTGNTQTVTIVSGIPSFYDVTYRDNSGLSVKTYETKILSIIPKTDPESVAMAANYSVEQNDYKDYTYTWEIVKKKIEAKWTNVAHTTTDGKTVYIPEITGVDAGVLKYEYTTDPDGEIKKLSDILSSYSETQISYYKVTVTIDSAYAASYELVDSAYVVQPSASQNFAVGNNKKSVTVSLQETKVYFNNQPQAVKLSYTGEGIILGDFAVEYKLLNADGSEGEATNVAPSAVGKYKVTITLQGEKANTHIIVGENVFEYVIAHKDRFILTAEAAASHPYKFLYEDFHEYEKDINEYLYNAENAESIVYIAHLAFEDTLADLLKQFANAEDITVYGADGTIIEDLTTLLATGMMLRMMDGETVLNQLTISVMGDIDGDGDIGTADKARLNSYTLGNLELKGASLLACDLDGDGEVGTADKARLNAYTLGNLDIYVGLILRATAQATSEAVSACDEPAVVTSATTEVTPLTTSAQVLSTNESTYAMSAVIECVDDCESTGDIAMAEYATLLQNNETDSAYTAIADITDIKNIAFATRVYADRKQRM